MNVHLIKKLAECFIYKSEIIVYYQLIQHANLNQTWLAFYSPRMEGEFKWGI